MRGDRWFHGALGRIEKSFHMGTGDTVFGAENIRDLAGILVGVEEGIYQIHGPLGVTDFIRRQVRDIVGEVLHRETVQTPDVAGHKS